MRNNVQRVSAINEFLSEDNRAIIDANDLRLVALPFTKKIALTASINADEGFKTLLSANFGIQFPMPNQFVVNSDLTTLWLSPYDWIVMVQDGDEIALFEKMSKVLADYSVIPLVSTDGLQQATLSGKQASIILNKGCSINFDEWQVGNVARCKFAAINLVIQQTKQYEFQLFWDNSFTHYIWPWFETAFLEFQ